MTTGIPTISSVSAPSTPRGSATPSPICTRTEGAVPTAQSVPQKRAIVEYKANNGRVYRLTLNIDPKFTEAVRQAAEPLIAGLNGQGDLERLQMGEVVRFQVIRGGIQVGGSEIKTAAASEVARTLRTPEFSLDSALRLLAQTYPKAHQAAQRVLQVPRRAAATTVPIQGLHNIGSSCYLNAALQLFAAPAIRTYLLQFPQAFGGGRNNPLYKFLEKYEQGKPISKEDLAAVQQLTGVRPGVQSDAHEAFCALARALNLSDLTQNSPLVAITQGLYTEDLVSSNPSWVSNAQQEPAFIGRILVVPEQGKNIKTLIQEQQTSPGTTNLRINETEVPVKTKTIFTTTPQSLLVQIRRDQGGGAKNSTQVDVQAQLKLPKGSIIGDGTPAYQLTGFSVHRGAGNSTNAAGGHWVSYRREGDQWLLFDDTRVEQVREKEFLAAARNGSQLFYTIAPAASANSWTVS